MRKTAFISILMISLLSNAQDEETKINTDVWVPFTRSWEAWDHEEFNSLHTKDVVRIGSRGIHIGDEYKRKNVDSMEKRKESGSRMKIEFCFDRRFVNGDVAYETGFYRVTSYTEPREPFVARFHVQLRKVDGVWKIASDFDSASIGGMKVSYEMYKELEFLHFQ